MKCEYKKKIDEILRVDHAGEYGAVKIYEGQLKGLLMRSKILKENKMFDDEISEIEHMRSQEIRHLEFFNEQLVKNKKMNTAFLPIWHLAGYYSGFLSGILGKNFAMAMTKAVEEVIDHHYLNQIEFLENNKNFDLENDHEFHSELLENLKKFRQEEIDHMNYAENYNRKSFEGKFDESFKNEKEDENQEELYSYESVDSKNISSISENLKKNALKIGSKIFEKSIKIGCHFAIFLSKKI
jgi:ubiquinone biosynthesis monooxygenase Coq7